MKPTASFDVFDTLLTRKVASPSSLFLIVGDRAARAGVVAICAADYRKERMRAEEEGRITAPGGEVNLDGIYRLFAATLALPNTAREALVRLELDVEAEMLFPVPGALELVRGARRRSVGVIFVSDMYLPEAFIREQLEKHGFWKPGDRLYVSSEWGTSKADGSLFRTILKTERLRSKSIHHLGDRKDADFTIPSQLGIKVRQCDACCLTRYEQLLEEFSVDSVGFSSLVAGTSRLTRLQVPAATSHLATISEIASSLVSPVITFYALWLLRQARHRRLQRLYFVARDGHLVKTVTDALIKVFGLSIETRYLYGSRQAWHLPAITDFSAASLSWLFEKTRSFTIRIILSRVQIIPEQVADILVALNWPQSTWDQPIGEESLVKLRADLLNSLDFRDRVEMIVFEKRDLVLRYLEQEGLFDTISWAMVDLGWHGRLQQSLEKLLGMKHPTRTLGLYFGLYADSPALSELQTASYLDWDLGTPPDSKEIPALVFLMESFCTAPHGSTIGYRSDRGHIYPLFREQGFEPIETWGVFTVHATVERFAGELKNLSLPKETLNWDSRSALIQILGTFSRNPLPAEARTWGAFPYEDEQGGAVRERLTTGYALNWENLRIALTFGDDAFLPASWKVLWHGGQMHTLSASNSLLRLALKVGKAKRKFGNYLRGAFCRLSLKQPKAAASK